MSWLNFHIKSIPLWLEKETVYLIAPLKCKTNIRETLMRPLIVTLYYLGLVGSTGSWCYVHRHGDLGDVNRVKQSVVQARTWESYSVLHKQNGRRRNVAQNEGGKKEKTIFIHVRQLMATVYLCNKSDLVVISAIKVTCYWPQGNYIYVWLIIIAYGSKISQR